MLSMTEFNIVFHLTEVSDEREEEHIVHTHLDNRLMDEEGVEELARRLAADEEDDFQMAQRMQEREVIGHSKTVYDEQRARAVARTLDEEDKQLEEDKVGAAIKPLEEEELRKPLQEVRDKLIAKQLEGAEIEKQFERVKREHAVLAKELEERTKKVIEVQEETESLRLAVKLQKKDLADEHQAMWKKTARSTHTQPCLEDDEKFARKLQINEDRFQYRTTHFEEDQPLPKTPPSESEHSEKIPCQWCNKPIPFEQVMLHQVSKMLLYMPNLGTVLTHLY